MSKKHPYKDIIEQWLSDTSTQVEILTVGGDGSHWMLTTIDSVIATKDGAYLYRIKPKQDQYEHLRKAAKEGKFVEEQFPDGWVRIAFSHDDVTFDKPAHNYRIVDEYEHLRRALRDGKKIERINHSYWKIEITKDIDHQFIFPADYYRIHDPYRELKEAQEQGKRVVRIKDDGGIEECFFGRKFDFDYAGFAPEQYKIVEHDITTEIIVSANDLGCYALRIKLTKSGIDGKITAEVVND